MAVYKEFLKAHSLPRLPIRLNQSVSTQILPALKNIGMNEPFVRAMIRIAMQAWGSTWKTDDNIHFFDPEALTMVAEVDRMTTGIRQIFPDGNVFQKKIQCHNDTSCFKMTLRHGCLGIVTIGKY